jgi:hypothetical protein
MGKKRIGRDEDADPGKILNVAGAPDPAEDPDCLGGCRFMPILNYGEPSKSTVKEINKGQSSKILIP